MRHGRRRVVAPSCVPSCQARWNIQQGADMKAILYAAFIVAVFKFCQNVANLP